MKDNYEEVEEDSASEGFIQYQKEWDEIMNERDNFSYDNQISDNLINSQKGNNLVEGFYYLCLELYSKKYSAVLSRDWVKSNSESGDYFHHKEAINSTPFSQVGRIKNHQDMIQQNSDRHKYSQSQMDIKVSNVKVTIKLCFFI